MPLYKRGKVWWIRYNYNGRQIRVSTETASKKLATMIHAKIVTEIVEDT